MAITKNNSFDNRKTATLRLLQEYQLLSKAPAEQISLVAAKRLQKLLQVTVQSGWWRNHLGFKQGPIDDVREVTESLAGLPLLDRQIIQKNFDWLRIWVAGSSAQDYVETSTSGSTGEPVRVKHYLPIYQHHYGAQELLDVMWSKRNLSKNFGYFRITQPPESGKKLGEPFSYLGDTGMVYGANILGASPGSLLDFMTQNNISYVSVNAMLQRVLAIEQLSNPRPDLQISQFLNWADPVSPELRKLVMQAFGARIIDRYSSNEFGYLALQCPGADHLHAPQVNNYIEILDSNNQPVGIGTPGRVVVTALNNYSQPLIRYELGDFASWGEGCEHGITFPVLEPTIVRFRDIYVDSKGQIRIPYPDGLSLIESGKVIRYQLFGFQDIVVLLAEFTNSVSQEEITQCQAELQEQFANLNLTAHVIELPGRLARRLSTWKNKKIITVPAPAPNPISVDALLGHLPKGQLETEI